MSADPSIPSSRSTLLLPGTILAGKYRVERLIGEGGMGWVVQAVHLQLDQQVALKFMHASSAAESPDAVARFLREARAAARIQSDYVARVSDVGTLDTGAPYLVMEYLEGQDLDSLIRERAPLPVEEAMGYALQACEGLAEAHAAGIVHRDLKPANLFLARKADGSIRVKLLDFGISKLEPSAGRASDAAKTGTRSLMGSPLYMAPEQMRSSKNVDRRADIWSMGVIVYEMLSGQPPFHGDTLPEICARILAEPPATLRLSGSTVPPALEAVITRCLEKDPDHRCPDVATLARALAAFGAPELRAAAERIARLLRVGAQSHSDLQAPLVPTLATGASPVAHTNASFGTASSHHRVRRSPAAAFGIGAVVATAVAAVAIIAARGGHGTNTAGSTTGGSISTGSSEGPPAAAPSGTMGAREPAPALPPVPSPAAIASTPDAPDVTSAPWTPEAAAQSLARAASAHTLAGTPAIATGTSPAAHAGPKPKAAPSTPKPSATAAFGGRD